MKRQDVRFDGLLLEPQETMRFHGFLLEPQGSCFGLRFHRFLLQPQDLKHQTMKPEIERRLVSMVDKLGALERDKREEGRGV